MAQHNQKLFKLDTLSSNCDCIIKYCSQNLNELNESIINDCNQLLKVAKFIDQVAYDYTFKGIPFNGFLTFLKVITSFTEKIVKQIEKKNKINSDFIKIFKIINNYRDLILIAHENLVQEKKNKKFTNELLVQKNFFSTNLMHTMIHSNWDTLPISLGLYPGFWLPKKMQKLLKFFNFCFAISYRFPRSAGALISSKMIGKYTFESFKNSTLDHPFNVWHQSENFWVSVLLNSIKNFKVPVKSVTLNIPKQVRFRLDYKGNILDFNQMTKQEIDDYFNDEEEQRRQNSPGLRHRNNRDTIKCRFSYIKTKEKIIESIENIEKNPKIYKKFNHYSAYEHVANQKEVKNLIQCVNQVEHLNIFETNNLIKDKINIKIRKNKFKYDGPKHKVDSNLDEFEDVTLNSLNKSKCKKISKIDNFDPNPEKIILIYFHGGGFFTQGPTSCELYLRDIVNELGGIPILAVDYSLTVPFPIPVQEALDVYLFLLSKRDDVKEMIGFHPKKIIISGDSAGGFFALVLTILINELNKKIGANDQNEYSISLPSALILEYSVLSLITFSPSRALSTLEPLVAFHPLMIVLSFFATNLSNNGDFKRLKNDERFKLFEEANKHLFSDDHVENEKDFKNKSKKKEDSKPWYLCDYATYKTRSDYIGSFYQHEFINPLIYQHFDELKNVDLYSIVGELDLLVDDSIELSKKWKGNVSLDVFSDVIHGYFYFSSVLENCSEATDLTIERLQTVCGLK